MTKRACDPSISAERIKKRRKQLGFTQKELSEKTGIALPTIKQYELGKRVPDGDFRIWLADALGVYERWLVGESDTMNLQANLNNLSFYIREKKSKEFEEIQKNWSDEDMKNHQKIQEMLDNLNQPMKVFKDLLELSGKSYESLERLILVDYGMPEPEFHELINAYFHNIQEFVSKEFEEIAKNAYKHDCYKKYIQKKEVDNGINKRNSRKKG